jgi:hypothetical protein
MGAFPGRVQAPKIRQLNGFFSNKQSKKLMNRWISKS